MDTSPPTPKGGGKNEDVNVDVDENEERGDTPKSESAPLKKEDVEHAYRIDLLVENKVIIELKAQDKLLPIHQTQLLTYLKLSNKKLGLLINFGGNSSDSFKRIINCTAITELDQDM